MNFQNFRQYISECARLLYWAYFKPFTFNQWLQREVHPNLEFDSNPFEQSQYFATIPKLRRYVDQMVWLSIVIPWLVTSLIAFPYTLFSTDPFVWSRSALLLAGWSLGVLLTTVVYTKFQKKWLNSSLFFAVFANISILLSFLLLLFVSVAVSRLAVGIAVGMALGVAFGMRYSVAIGVALGVVFGMTSYISVAIALGMTLGVSGSVMFSIGSGMVFGMVFGMAFGVIVGVTYGIVFTITYLIGKFRLWSWLPELGWITFLYLFLPPTKQRLQWLPPYFDEVIGLPLPFMTTILTETYRIDPQATQATIDHLLNRTNQQRVAGQAMLWITLDNLLHCQKEEDIALASQQLEWMIYPLPKEMGKLIPLCLYISQSVQAARKATSFYHHAKMLEEPLELLTRLHQQWPYEKNARVAAQLKAITQQWQKILEESHHTLKEQVKQSQPLPVPYLAGSALNLDSEVFRGRQDLFRRFEELTLAEQPPVLLLYGGRRAGKTSTLKQLPQRLPPTIVPLLIDSQQLAVVTTLTGIALSLVDTMTEVAHRDCNLYLPDYDPQAFAQDPFFALGKWFKQIENTFPNNRFFLCLDEFERLQVVVSTTGSHAPLNFLRNLFQHQPRWVVLFAGSHYLNELENYWSDYLINAQILHVSYLEKIEAIDLIIKPTSDFPNNVYDDGAVSAIIYHTHSQPYLVQLLCLTVVEYLNRQQRQRATAKTVEDMIPAAIKMGLLYFNELWNNILKEPHHKVLAQVVRHQLLAKEDKTIEAVNYLISKEVLERVESNYYFQVPLVQRFVEGQLRGEWG